MKKLLALLMALLMCACTLIACGETTEGDDDDKKGHSISDVDPNRGTPPEVKDFDGYEFRIQTNVWSEDYEMAAPTEMNGQGVNDQIYDRNKAVEYAYNITIVEEAKPDTSDDEATAFLNNMKVSGDYYADLYSFVAAGMIPNMATQGHFVNLYDEDVKSQLRLNESWWNQDFLSETTINGHAYCLTGDMQTNDDLAMISLMMNNTLYQQNFTEETIYDIVVTNKTWTFEKFFGLWQNFGKSNGTAETGAIDPKAQVGYSYDGQTAMYYMISSGIKTFKMDNGAPTLNVNSDRALGVVDWLKKLVKANSFDASPATSRVTGPYRYTYDGVRSHFQSGGLLFTTNNMEDALSWYTSMNDEVVYLPFPKYDVEQEGYHTPTHWLFEPLAISVNVTDYGRTALITEALGFYSDKLKDEVADLLIQERLSHDLEAREILITTLDSKAYDMDYMAGITGLRDKLSKMIGAGSFENYASEMKSLSTTAIRANGKGTLQKFVQNYTSSKR